jgi:hypothetical protein
VDPPAAVVASQYWTPRYRWYLLRLPTSFPFSARSFSPSLFLSSSPFLWLTLTISQYSLYPLFEHLKVKIAHNGSAEPGEAARARGAALPQLPAPPRGRDERWPARIEQMVDDSYRWP